MRSAQRPEGTGFSVDGEGDVQKYTNARTKIIRND